MRKSCGTDRPESRKFRGRESAWLEGAMPVCFSLSHVEGEGDGERTGAPAMCFTFSLGLTSHSDL